MGAADLKVMGTLSPRKILRGIFRGRLRPFRIQLGKGNCFQIGRSKQPAIECVEGMSRIVPICDPDSWTDLAFVSLVLHGVTADSHVEGPVLIGSPLILNPELLAPTDQSIVGIDIDHSSCRIAHPVIEKRKQSRLVDRLGAIDLKSGLDHMLLTMDKGVIEPHSTGITRAILAAGRKGFGLIRNIGQDVERVCPECSPRVAEIPGQTKKVAGINVTPPHHMAILVVLLLIFIHHFRRHRSKPARQQADDGGIQ